MSTLDRRTLVVAMLTYFSSGFVAGHLISLAGDGIDLPAWLIGLLSVVVCWNLGRAPSWRFRDERVSDDYT